MPGYNDLVAPIQSFRGEYYYLSNFWICEVWHDGIRYPSTEHAFQAAKTLNFNERWKISQLPATREGCVQAKHKGRELRLRPDWEQCKRQVMFELVLHKFTVHRDLRQKLLGTAPAQLIEGNNWGDVYWGMVNGQGANWLGQILMRVRGILEPIVS